MTKKAFRLPRIAPLQRITAESITDPAQQAALDKLRRRLKRKATARTKRSGGASTPKQQG